MSADPSQQIILGSRGSELARAQTAMVVAALRRVWPALEVNVEIIKTRGDERSVQHRAPVDPRAGRKGLFTGEIERALAAGEIDVAVHSAKDLPSDQTPGLEVRSVLPRAAVEDVLISKNRGGLMALPDGCVVGTGSVRRQSQLRWRRPDLHTFELRGNVPTRLRKLDENPWEAIVLARAGIERLGHVLWPRGIRVGSHSFFAEVLDTEFFLPAGGQGVIALQVRSDDSKTKKIVQLVNDMPTLLCLRAEREFLRLLRGDCGTPVGVLAMMKEGIMTIRGQVFEDGAVVPKTACVEGAETTPELLAYRLLEAIGGK
jgi:hydroxymethylbilane synthase